jgi:hypothetical protein
LFPKKFLQGQQRQLFKLKKDTYDTGRNPAQGESRHATKRIVPKNFHHNKLLPKVASDSRKQKFKWSSLAKIIAWLTAILEVDRALQHTPKDNKHVKFV